VPSSVLLSSTQARPALVAQRQSLLIPFVTLSDEPDPRFSPVHPQRPSTMQLTTLVLAALTSLASGQ
jgi:hypothetical protein